MRQHGHHVHVAAGFRGTMELRAAQERERLEAGIVTLQYEGIEAEAPASGRTRSLRTCSWRSGTQTQGCTIPDTSLPLARTRHPARPREQRPRKRSTS